MSGKLFEFWFSRENPISLLKPISILKYCVKGLDEGILFFWFISGLPLQTSSFEGKYFLFKNLGSLGINWGVRGEYVGIILYEFRLFTELFSSFWKLRLNIGRDWIGDCLCIKFVWSLSEISFDELTLNEYLLSALLIRIGLDSCSFWDSLLFSININNYIFFILIYFYHIINFVFIILL